MTRAAAANVNPAPEEESANGISRVVIVRIPARFSEQKVETLMGSMRAQFEGTGYKVIFSPEEAEVYTLR